MPPFLPLSWSPIADDEPVRLCRRRLTFMAAVAIGLRWWFLATNGGLLLPDALGRYLPIADRLFEAWRGTVFDAPAYPAFIALSNDFFGSGWPLLAFQGLLDSGTAVLAALIAARLGFRKGAWFVGWYWALYPAAIIMSNAVLTETLFTFCLTCSVWLIFKGLYADRTTMSCFFGLAGLLLAIMSLTRPNGILTLLVIAGMLILCRDRQRSFLPIFLLVLCAMLPIVGWIRFNSSHRNVTAIAQGGGWQWCQNMAYFDLIDPQFFPGDEAVRYDGWQSLGSMRARLSRDSNIAAHDLDGVFGSAANQSARAKPLRYIATIPKALLLPRAFIKDVTGMGAKPDRWQVHHPDIHAAGYGRYVKDLNVSSPITMYIQWFRGPTTFKGRYTLLLLISAFALWLAVRSRSASLCFVTLLPGAQAAALLLMLNPIERYYFPFELFLIVSTLAVFNWKWSQKVKKEPTTTCGS